MTIKLTNTLTGKLEEFKSIKPGEVKLFVCGPTVYDYSHLGHGKTYTQFDFLARFLKYLGFEVEYIVNITDIDDKIIRRAKERGVEPMELAREFEGYYLEDMKALGNISIDKYARAYDYIPQIVDQVKRLIDKGVAYKIGDGYYFDTKKFVDYGKLSGRDSVRDEDAVSRIDENPEKRNPGDFCLWKFSKVGEPSWDSEMGAGRPGWHIEDTAITEHEFGPQYDIHGGAIDLIFPHHEAEIAQMESISGKSPLVRYWLHTGFLNIKSEKMSKSLGNFATIRDVFSQGISPLALRYYFFGSHYRSPINFTFEALQAGQNAYRKLTEFASSLPQSEGKLNNRYKEMFKGALEDDLNTPEALAVVWKLVKDESVAPVDKRTTLLDFDQVLGLRLDENEYVAVEIPEDVKRLVEERKQAREAKEWQKADELRDNINKAGFEVSDTDTGPKIFKL